MDSSNLEPLPTAKNDVKNVDNLCLLYRQRQDSASSIGSRKSMVPNSTIPHTGLTFIGRLLGHVHAHQVKIRVSLESSVSLRS